MYLAVISGDEDAITPLPAPVTRIDMYLAHLAGEEVAELPEPVTRVDCYLAALCGMDVVLPDEPLTRIDFYLAALNGEAVDVPEAITRIDTYLSEWAEGGSTGRYYTLTGEPPLTLPNAVAAKIRSLIRYGSVTDGVINNGTVTADGDSIIVTGTPEEVRVTGKNWFKDTFDGWTKPVNYWIYPITLSEGEWIVSATLKTGKTKVTGCAIGFATGGTDYASFQKIRICVDTGGNASTPPYSSIISTDSPKLIFYGTAESFAQIMDTYDIQLELGSTATEYEPYTSQTATVADLYAVGDIVDEHDLISGKVTRRTEAKVEDGQVVIDIRGQQYSGSTVTFEADSVKPIDKVEVGIEPQQDLHGYDSPWPAGGGKNIFDAKTWVKLGNNASFYSVAEDETITVDASDGSGISQRLFDLEPSTTYAFFVDRIDNVSVRLIDSGGGNIPSNNGVFTTPSDGKIAIKFTASTYPSSLKFILAKDSTAPSSWTPYSNICPISGFSSITVTDNDTDTAVPLGRTVYGGTHEVVSGNGQQTMAMVDLGTLNWSAGFSGFYTTGISTLVEPPTSLGEPNALCSQYPWGTSGNNRFFIHNQQNYSGWVTVRTSDYSTATEFKSAMSGVQLVYELATPVPFTTDPVSISTQVGENVMSADSGDIAVTLINPLVENVTPQPLTTSEGTNTVDAYGEMKVEYKASEAPPSADALALNMLLGGMYSRQSGDPSDREALDIILNGGNQS